METRANLIKIGLFVLAVILAGFGGAFWLLKGDQKGPRSVVEVDFQGSVGGLLPGAAVAYNGIKVGEVTKVVFADNDPNRVITQMLIDTSAPIRTDSVVGLGFSGLTGYATVQITGGSADAPMLLAQKGVMPIIKADSASAQDLMGGARHLMGQADSVLTTIAKVVNDAAPAVTNTIKNVETVTDSLAKNAKNIDKFLASVGDAADTLTKVSGRIDKLTTDLDTIATAVDHDKIAKIVANVATISDQVAKSSVNLQGMTDDIKQSLSDTRKVIAAIDPVKVASTVDQVSKLSQYLSAKTGDFDDILKSAKAASANIDTISAAIAGKNDDITKFIADATSTIHQVEIASHRLDPILAKVDGIVGSEAGQGLIAQGKSFLIEATEAAKAFKNTSAAYGSKANELTEAVLGLVADGRKTLATVNRAVTDFDRNPQQLLFGAKSGIPEYGAGRK